jgi:hypothetical protein
VFAAAAGPHEEPDDVAIGIQEGYRRDIGLWELSLAARFAQQVLGPEQRVRLVVLSGEQRVGDSGSGVTGVSSPAALA